MIINQFAPVIEKQFMYGLRPELDDQAHSIGFIFLVLFIELDRAIEEIFRAIIS